MGKAFLFGRVRERDAMDDAGLTETQGWVQGETEDGYFYGTINKVRQSLVLRKC